MLYVWALRILLVLVLEGKSWADLLHCGVKQSIPQTRLRFQKEMIGLEMSSEGEEMESEGDEVGGEKGKGKGGGSGKGVPKSGGRGKRKGILKG